MKHPFNKEFFNSIQPYLATAGGVLIVTFSDTLKNGGGTRDTSALHRASEGLRGLFPAGMAAYAQAWLTLLVLIFLALILCWLAKPDKKRDAFTLGLSIYALLAAFSPTDLQQNDSATQSVLKVQASLQQPEWNLISSAYADDIRKTWDYYLHFVNPDRTTDTGPLTVHVFDKDEQNSLGSIVTKIGTIVQLNLKAGTYVLYVECGGCGRARYVLDVNKLQYQASEIEVTSSNIPLSVQRLFRPTLGSPKDLSMADAQKVSEEYAKQHVNSPD